MNKLFSKGSKAKQRKTLPPEKLENFYRILNETRRNSRFDESRNYIQHGSTSVRKHCIMVAYTAYYLSYKFKVDINEDELVKGALLHDYFLYDWHEKSWANSIHGYTHPGKALKEAKKDFYLSAVERDMIKHHMFPLTPTPPSSKEGALLCVADKLCAIRETLEGKGKLSKGAGR